ncbi:hypothetical protein D3C72_1656870 [compost metagenome]
MRYGFHDDLATARTDDAQLVGRDIGQVHDPVAVERAAVVHAHDDRLAVDHAGDARVAGNRQRGVGGRHGVHVVGLADRRGIAMEFLAIPGGSAALFVRLAAGVGHVTLAEDNVRTVRAAGVGLEPGHRIRNLIQIGRRVVVRPVVLVVAPAFLAPAGGRAARHGNGQQQNE